MSSMNQNQKIIQNLHKEAHTSAEMLKIGVSLATAIAKKHNLPQSLVTEIVGDIERNIMHHNTTEKGPKPSEDDLKELILACFIGRVRNHLLFPGSLDIEQEFEKELFGKIEKVEEALNPEEIAAIDAFNRKVFGLINIQQGLTDHTKRLYKSLVNEVNPLINDHVRSHAKKHDLTALESFAMLLPMRFALKYQDLEEEKNGVVLENAVYAACSEVNPQKIGRMWRSSQ